MAESGGGVPLCNTCGEQIGVNANGELFVACHHCDFPICKSCYDLDINEGRSECLRCGTPYVYEDKITENNDTEAPGNQSTIAPEFSNPQDVGLLARHVTTVSTVEEREVNGESGGNPIWKNRVESWKSKDKKEQEKEGKGKGKERGTQGRK